MSVVRGPIAYLIERAFWNALCVLPHGMSWSRSSAGAVFCVSLAFAAPAAAATGLTFAPTNDAIATPGTPKMASLTFIVDERTPPDLVGQAAAQAGQPSTRPVVFEYSEGYQTRLKIHKIASLATIPLFVAEGVVGEKLYNDPTSGKRTAHLWIATGIGVLFGVNSVTGIWNLSESSKDPNGRARRLTHSILMLAADGAFFATAVTGPGHHMRDPSAYANQRGVHRTLAFTSVTLASIGYGMMFVWPH